MIAQYRTRLTVTLARFSLPKEGCFCLVARLPSLSRAGFRMVEKAGLKASASGSGVSAGNIYFRAFSLSAEMAPSRTVTRMPHSASWVW